MTGLPVAEDTFGAEMFKQMGIAAPAAGLLVLLLMFFFFRSASLVIAPMLVALATVVTTMGLLIGAGFTVHIMSSMIPIFLMPIAVVDSVHILSEFADTYPRIGDRRETVRVVMRLERRPPPERGRERDARGRPHLLRTARARFERLPAGSLQLLNGAQGRRSAPAPAGAPTLQVSGAHGRFGAGMRTVLIRNSSRAQCCGLQGSIPTGAGSPRAS